VSFAPRRWRPCARSRKASSQNRVYFTVLALMQALGVRREERAGLGLATSRCRRKPGPDSADRTLFRVLTMWLDKTTGCMPAGHRRRRSSSWPGHSRASAVLGTARTRRVVARVGLLGTVDRGPPYATVTGSRASALRQYSALRPRPRTRTYRGAHSAATGASGPGPRPVRAHRRERARPGTIPDSRPIASLRGPPAGPRPGPGPAVPGRRGGTKPAASSHQASAWRPSRGRRRSPAACWCGSIRTAWPGHRGGPAGSPAWFAERVVERQAAEFQCNQRYSCEPPCSLCRPGHGREEAGPS
jgi:hypothetical protein